MLSLYFKSSLLFLAVLEQLNGFAAAECTSTNGGTIVGDKITCSNGSCVGATISGCKEVVCEGSGSCFRSTFVGDGDDASTSTMTCTDNSCQLATITGFQKVICEHSCVTASMDAEGIQGSTLECREPQDTVGPITEPCALAEASHFTSIFCKRCFELKAQFSEVWCNKIEGSRFSSACVNVEAENGTLNCNSERACWFLNNVTPKCLKCSVDDSCRVRSGHELFDIAIPIPGNVDSRLPPGEYGSCSTDDGVAGADHPLEVL